MIYLYFICDPELKGDLLLQSKHQFKMLGLKFFFSNRKDLPSIAHNYLFGRVGVVVLPAASVDFISTQLQKITDMIQNFPLLKLMGLQIGGLFFTPTVWKDLVSVSNHFLTHSYYLLPIASFAMLSYVLQLSLFYQLAGVSRSLLYVSSFNNAEWRPFISE